MRGRLTRRKFLATTGGAAIASAVLPTAAARARAGSPFPLHSGAAAADEVAAIYNHALLLHTRWAEQVWDASAGYFSAQDFNFAVALGNAVLLKYGDYDASMAGVSAATLHEQTVATITHFAASNKLAGGTEWGETLYWDSTFELYFGLAARLLWDDLDAATQTNIAEILTGQANNIVAMGNNNTSTNGLAGGYVGDTKTDEMAVPAQCLGPAVAWYPGDSNAASWKHWLNLWLLNDTGLPPADQANTFQVDGEPISQWNTAHNIYDTFLVENHGSFSPCYQEETWRMSGRVAAHFMAAGQPVPAAVTAKPNGRQLWATMMQVMSNSGEPLMPMINDRYHLFGRDVIPLTFLAQVLGDRYAARAEAMLAAQLIPYQQYPPQYRLTKFSGEAKYEPEARAELGICYLFHLWRARSGARVTPVSEDEFFAAASGATDYGAGPGLVAQCTPAAFAATVTKPGFVKCVYVPGHDDWLFDVSGATPFLLPSTAVTVTSRSAAAYNALRDSFDGTAALLTLSTGYAGFATLPTGTAVYATSGNGAGEGSISVFNLNMPGVPGLGGQRTYSGADCAVTISAGTAESHTVGGNWLNVDGRAGFVVSGSTNPITVTAGRVTLSDGPAAGSAGMVIEGYAAQSPADTQAAAERSRPSDGPAGLAASIADGYLSLFNLSGAAIGPASVTIRQDSSVLLYRGRQSTVSGGTAYEVSLPAAKALVEPPRFGLASRSPLPSGLQITVTDSKHVSVMAPADSPVVYATMTSRATGENRPVNVHPGQTVQLTFNQGRLTPSSNLALGRTTYPTSPLPATTSDPAFAVDGNPATSWRPGPGGRMVVDLGSQLGLGTMELTWIAGRAPPAAISVSADGMSFTSIGSTPGGPTGQRLTLGTSARYVALSVPGWSVGDASLTEISVLAPG